MFDTAFPAAKTTKVETAQKSEGASLITDEQLEGVGGEWVDEDLDLGSDDGLDFFFFFFYFYFFFYLYYLFF